MSLPFGELYYRILSFDISTNINNYQIKVELNTSNFNYSNTKSDGGDIRFVTMSDISLNYYIEKWDISGDSIIWVKIPDSGTTQIKLLYGNNSLTSLSNGDNVFNFFDDYNGSSIDTSKWIIDDNTGFDVSNGFLKGTNSTGRLRSQTTFSQPIIFETKHLLVEDNQNGYIVGGFYGSQNDGISVLIHETDREYLRNDSTWVGMDDVIQNGDLFLLKIAVNSNTANVLITDICDNSTMYSQSHSNTVSNENLLIGLRPDDVGSGQTYEGYWDWTRVRQFMTTEPIITLGAEQQDAGGFGDPLIRPVFGKNYYLPNDESTYLLLQNDNLQIYTKTWIPYKNKMSFMKYLFIRFNNEQICIDLDNMKFIEFNLKNIKSFDPKYISNIPNIKNLDIKYNNIYKYIQDFEKNKKYKVTKLGKQIQLNFNFNKYQIILEVITDLFYKDIRNTSFIKFTGDINIYDIQNMSGAFIEESKCKKIRDEKLEIKKIYV
jgi:hypothetical protein